MTQAPLPPQAPRGGCMTKTIPEFIYPKPTKHDSQAARSHDAELSYETAPHSVSLSAGSLTRSKVKKKTKHFTTEFDEAALRANRRRSTKANTTTVFTLTVAKMSPEQNHANNLRRRNAALGLTHSTSMGDHTCVSTRGGGGVCLGTREVCVAVWRHTDL